MTFTATSEEETFALGRALGGAVEAGDVVGLTGDLGAGKTLFVQGLARGLNVPDTVRVVSPTFTLVNEYPGGRLPLHHADLYRLEDEGELDHIGLYDAMGGPGVVAVEWADRFDVMPRDCLAIRIEVVDDATRRLHVSARGKRSEGLLSRWSSSRS